MKRVVGVPGGIGLIMTAWGTAPEFINERTKEVKNESLLWVPNASSPTQERQENEREIHQHGTGSRKEGKSLTPVHVG